MNSKIKIYIFLTLISASCSQSEPIVPNTNLLCSDLNVVDGKIYQNELLFNGSCITIYEGSIQRNEVRSYKNGIRDGVWAKFYFNSNINYKGYAKNGEITGKYRSYFDNGTLQDSGVMKNGFKDGIWFKFDIYGKLRRKTQFKDKQIINDKIFDEYVY